MKNNHITDKIALFALQSAYPQLENDIVDQLKKHLLDAVASMVYAVGNPTVNKCFREVAALQSGGPCKVPVIGSTGADRAAQLYTLLIRYPDFMDNFLGKHATCHPSDNIGGILAASQLVNASGRDFLTVMAIAYQVECTLIVQMPLMAKGIDHTALLAMSLTAALASLLSLTEEQAAHAIGIAASSFNTTVTTRAAYTYEWKGYASSLIAFNCMNIVLLAKEGVTGPVTYFEGPMGFKEEFGMTPVFDCEKGDFSLIRKCILKSHNAEVHTQSAIEALLVLRERYHLFPEQIESIDVTVFLTAYHIVGGGKYGDRKRVATKEQADHSLPYLLAVALMDGEVQPAQLLPSRIREAEVQALLQKVHVHTNFPAKSPRKLVEKLDSYTVPYPDKMPVKITITLKSGKIISLKKEDYKGFHTRPLSWEDVETKFMVLTAAHLDPMKQQQLIETILHLEDRPVRELTDQLSAIREHVPVYSPY